MNLNEATFNHKEYFQVSQKYNSNSHQSCIVNKKKMRQYIYCTGTFTSRNHMLHLSAKNQHPENSLNTCIWISFSYKTQMYSLSF